MLIKTWRDPYVAGFTPTKPKEIELKPGLTVLVGCNGAGKSTLLLNIGDECKKQHIPCFEYDNLKDGGNNSLGELLYSGNYEDGAYLFSSSEGECIKANLGRKSGLFSGFIDRGIVDDQFHKFVRIFSDKEEVIAGNDRVFLFDALDSGLSVDSVIEIKALFDVILNDYRDTDKNIYIIIAANEYELARDSDCFDVNSGKYLRFKDYEDYRSFILKSRQKKEERINHQIKWQEKQRQKEIKEYLKIKERQKEKMEALRIKKEKGLYVSSWEERDIVNMDRDYLHTARFLTKSDVETINNS